MYYFKYFKVENMFLIHLKIIQAWGEGAKIIKQSMNRLKLA